MMNLYLEQFDPQYDFPAREKPDKYYVILFTPRSGSNLLGHYLYITGKMGFPLEYFNPVNFEQWQRRFGTKGFKDTYRFIRRFRTSPNGYFGSKFHLSFHKTFRDECGYAEVFPDAKYIYIRREEILSQALSLAKARMTGQYISFQKLVRDATYSYDAIKKALVHIAVDDAKIRYFVGKRSINCCEVTYEELCRDPAQIISRVAKHLETDFENVPGIDHLLMPNKQANDQNLEFRERFIRESKRSSINDDLEQIGNLFPRSGRAYCRAVVRLVKERLTRKLVSDVTSTHFDLQTERAGGP